MLYVNLQRYDGDAIFVSTYEKGCCHLIVIATFAKFGWRNKMHQNIISEDWHLHENCWVEWSPQVLSGNHAKFDVENDIIDTSDASAGSRAHHYNDFIMGAIASQITSLTICLSTVYSNTDQRKHQSSASLAFVRGVHRRPGEFPAQMASNAEDVSIWWRHHVIAPHSTQYHKHRHCKHGPVWKSA